MSFLESFIDMSLDTSTSFYRSIRFYRWHFLSCCRRLMKVQFNDYSPINGEDNERKRARQTDGERIVRCCRKVCIFSSGIVRKRSKADRRFLARKFIARIRPILIDRWEELSYTDFDKAPSLPDGDNRTAAAPMVINCQNVNSVS